MLSIKKKFTNIPLTVPHASNSNVRVSKSCFQFPIPLQKWSKQLKLKQEKRTNEYKTTFILGKCKNNHSELIYFCVQI